MDEKTVFFAVVGIVVSAITLFYARTERSVMLGGWTVHRDKHGCIFWAGVMFAGAFIVFALASLAWALLQSI